jgi:hypothetical protein
LGDADCGELLGRYYEQLAACARALRACYDELVEGCCPGKVPARVASGAVLR